jgi:glycerol 3-phosphatase-1
MEGIIPKRYGDDATEIPGARALLDAVIASSAPWAIVTSGTVPLVTGWLHVLRLPRPEHLITAEDVAEGKPDPGCYLLARERLRLAGTGSGENGGKRVLVIEDSPAGILAGRAADCKVIGLVTSHTVEQIVAAVPDWIVRDLESVKLISSQNGSVTLEISNALVRR